MIAECSSCLHSRIVTIVAIIAMAEMTATTAKEEVLVLQRFSHYYDGTHHVCRIAHDECGPDRTCNES